MDLFTTGVYLTGFALGLIILFVVMWVFRDLVTIVGIRPGFLRGIFGFGFGFIFLPLFVGNVRLLLMVLSLIDVNSTVSSGTAFMFAGFGGLTGWLWGVGTFSSYSHEHHGMEHLREMKPKQTLTARVVGGGTKRTPGFIRWLIPFLRPMFIALTVCVVVVVIFMALGMIQSPITRVQTDTPLASAVTPAGSIIFTFGTDVLAVNKTVFFVIIALGLLVTMAVLAVVLALIFGALSSSVDKAKKDAPDPLKTEPVLFKLVDFYVTWIGDILEGTRRSISR